MTEIGLGAGLGAIAFWGFVAAVSVAGIWSNLRKREAQHETLRRLIESGQKIDPAVVDKLMSLSEGGSKRLDRELRVYGLIMLCIAPGIALLGWFVSQVAAGALMPLLGASALAGCVAVGLLLAASVAARWHRDDDPFR